MILEPGAADTLQVYQALVGLIAPRPIAWVSTISAEGVPNLAPFSFFTGAGVAPPALVFSVMTRPDGSDKDTLRNIEATGEFVVNIVPFALAAAMNASSADVGPEVNEFERAGITAAASRVVRPPSVAESPGRMECRLRQIVRVGSGPWSGAMIIGEIVSIYMSDEALDARGRIEPRKLDLIGRMGGVATYARTTEMFEIPRPGRNA